MPVEQEDAQMRGFERIRRILRRRRKMASALETREPRR